jgi:hypothetical protein
LPTWLGWTRSSYYLFSAFLLTLLVLTYVWWPLVLDYWSYADFSRPWWTQVDWLLIGIFLFMSLLLMAGADVKSDLPWILVGLGGGLAIESWGTQTELWTYYTLERPPLWIIPAWPIAGLSIERLVRLGMRWAPAGAHRLYRLVYWLLLPAFILLMLSFVRFTLDKPLTILALVFCTLLIATPTDPRRAVLTFAAGAGLGYFLELWGTTRLCWMYYTGEQPPLFAVLAHGMAAIAFWRVTLIFAVVWARLRGKPPQSDRWRAGARSDAWSEDGA